MNLIGISYKQIPVEIRENIVINKQELPSLLRRLAQKFSIEELLILSTCNRTEIYYIPFKTQENFSREIFDDLLKFKEFTTKNLPVFIKEGKDSYRYLFRVASGLESMIIGESQILAQIKNAVKISKEHHLFRPKLEYIFQKMLYTAKKIRSETKISENAVSVGTVAVELTKTIFDNLSQKRILVIGAGETSELILQHLKKNGVSRIFITNRTFKNTLKLAEKFHGSAIWYEERYNYLQDVDIVISSTGADGLVITKSLAAESIKKRKKPIFFIDIAIPRDIDPQIANLSNSYIYHIDDLQKVIYSNYDLRKKESTKAEIILENELEDFWHSLGWKKKSFLVEALKTKQKKITQQELDILFTKNPILKNNKYAIENLIYRVTQKFLHDPCLFLKKQYSSEAKEIFSNIFGIAPVKEKK